MTKIIRAGDLDSLGHLDTIQGDFRTQIDAVTDAVRQLGGNPEIEPGSGTVNDPLNAPYVLYVDSNVGRDTFVAGDYANADDGSFEQKMRRISMQRLECGYTLAAPFRTLSRAVIEAGIITSRDYLDLVPAPCGDLVTIVLSSGVHIALNGDGGTVSGTWTDGYVPTDADLTAFNPSNGGIVLPRGCSVVSLDLRKTIIRPDFVPAPADEATDGSNRRAIFKVTGGCYLYGFTIMDQVGFDKSHHLLDGVQFAGQAGLAEFYSKIRAAFSGIANISDAFAVPRLSEYQITGPQPEIPVEAVDTTAGASPYLYNISIRSEYGICGMWANGALTDGFKSMVVAQYTGASLQRDLDNWEEYSGGTWGTFSSYDDLIATSPNDVRFKIGRRSYHVRTSNGAIIQEVSVFAIGQALHHVAESGSQITITNSNSNFGGCASLANGFQEKATPIDTPWLIEKIRRPISPFEKTGNVKRIFLGTLVDTQANAATTLELTADFDEELLTNQGYSLEAGNYVWVENAGGPDYRALLSDPPIDPLTPDKVSIQSRVETDTGINPDDNSDNNTYTDIAGSRIYVRRLRDVRSVEERRYSIINSNTSDLRRPIRDYVIQPEGDGLTWTDRIQAVAASERTDEVPNGVNVELRYSKRPESETDFEEDTYYRPADVVRKDNKHWFSSQINYGPWDEENWDESYVHMEEEYAPEGWYKNAQPVILFNTDNDGNEDSADLGNSLSDPYTEAQIVSAVDYIGVYHLLQNLGVDAFTAAGYLEPQPKDSRDLDVSAEFWSVEFRRPTTIRLFGHAFEWAGYSNYSKGLPQYQGELSPSNQFTYFFTNQDGGKVYGSGFNQDGLTVSPRGLEDITTGEIIALEDIGNPNRPIDIPEVVFVWTRVGTTLIPTNAGDEVNVTAPDGTPKIVLNPDGSGVFIAKVQSASTVKTDPGQTLVTKDYLEGDGGFEGTLGFWTREGTDLYPSNGNTDSVKLGGVLPGTPAISLNASGLGTYTSHIISGATSLPSQTVVASALRSEGLFQAARTNANEEVFQGFDSSRTLPNSVIYAGGLAQFGDDPLSSVRVTGVQIKPEGEILARGELGTSYLYEGFVEGANSPNIAIFASGNIYLGGNIPSAPNIELRADGTAGFGGRSASSGRTIEIDSRSAAGIRIKNVAGPNVCDRGALINFWDTSQDINAGQLHFGANENDFTFTQPPDGANKIARETARLTHEGNFLIGGTLPAAPNIELNADGNGVFHSSVTAGNGVFTSDGVSCYSAGQITLRRDGALRDSFEIVTGGTASTNKVYTIKNNGTVYIGGTDNLANPNILLENTGEATKRFGGTAWAVFSDSRLKENVQTYSKGLNEILQISPIIFDYINGATQEVSVIAQDVETIFPECVSRKTGLLPDGSEVDDIRTFNPSAMQFALINSVKEMATRIEALEAEVNALKGA